MIGEFKDIVRFTKENKQIILSPIMLSRELRKRLGEVEVVKTSIWKTVHNMYWNIKTKLCR